MDPIAEISLARRMAYEQHDSTAYVCTLATVTPAGEARARIMVLNGICGRAFELECSTQSSKWQDLITNPSYELLIYWPSVQRQYRIRGTLEPASAEQEERSWQEMAHHFKLMELFYTEVQPLGSPLSSQADLLHGMASLKQKYPEGSPIPKPEHFKRFHCMADWIEALYIDNQRLHERHIYTYHDGAWQHQLLVP